MAAENLGSLFTTKMPGYDDAADIQAALKLFLYGTTDDTIINTTNPEVLPNPSLARHLQDLSDSITELDQRGVGSIYSATEPVAPADGFIWVNSTLSGSSIENNIFYQTSQPSITTEGAIWIDKDSSPLTMYVYDSVSGWRAIGS